MAVNILKDFQSKNKEGYSRFWPKMEKPSFKEYFSPEHISEAINEGAGALSGMNVLKAAPEAYQVAKKGVEYLQPEKEAERFRSTLGSGTSAENIETLGNRVGFAKKSALEEALIPKRELYQQEGKSNVYDVKPESLPEGNLPKMAEMIEGGSKAGTTEMGALSKAIKDYRKSGNIESFLDRSEEIFNIPDLPEKAVSKIEDALLMPTKRDSAYLSEKGVTDFYGKHGLKTLHNAYEEKPILNNYDALQSELKKQIRVLKSKGKSRDSLGDEKLDALTANVKNLNADKEAFMETLPDKMKNLENEFRKKYAVGVAKFEDAPLAMRKLAEGRSSELSSAQIGALFSKPTKEVKAILKDLGPEAAKNILYNALQKVPVGDAEGLANTILDLKRTKGYDQFVDQKMEDWANSMLKHVKIASGVKNSMKVVGGAAAGGALLGPLGAVGGAALPFIKPFAKQGMKYLSERLRK